MKMFINLKCNLKILIFIFLKFSFFAQNIDKLDEKKGFKEILIGDSFDKWKSSLKYNGINNDGSSEYLFIGSCCKKLFDYNIEQINIVFYQNKIVEIRIITEKFQKPKNISGEFTEFREDDFKKINDSFISLFGKPSSVEIPENSGIVIYYWISKNIYLFSKYEYLGVNNGDRQVVIVSDLKYSKKSLEDGF